MIGVLACIDSPLAGRAVALSAVIHAGKLYKSNHVRHAKPVKQLIQMIRSPKRKNTTTSASITWVRTRKAR